VHRSGNGGDYTRALPTATGIKLGGPFIGMDRNGGLIAFGIVQILIGIVCAMFVLGVVASSELAARSGVLRGSVGTLIFAYGLVAVHFITCGIGSIRARRWARAMSAAVAALWLAGGIVATISTATIVPKLIPHSPLITLTVVVFFLFIALPLAIFAFYARADVRATCERRDPKTRWTDRVPVAVLAVVIVMAFAAGWLLVNMSAPMLPLFGTILTGAPAALALLALAALCGFLAVQLYRLKESAWWTLVLLQIGGCAVAAASMARTPGPIYRDPVVWTIVIATWIGYLTFLIYLRRYFAGGRSRPRVVEAT